MPELDLSNQSLLAVIAVFVIGGVVVCWAGARLARLADALSAQTGMSEAIAGALLLGVATSLPEVITTVVAASLDNASLAVNNLFGGVAMQLAVLAFIDVKFVQRGPLTFFSPSPALLLSAVFLILLLGLSIIAMATGDVALFGRVGLWPLALAASYGASLYFMSRFSERETWTASRLPEKATVQARGESSPNGNTNEQSSSLVLATKFGLYAAAVLFAGGAVSTSADALTEKTPLGSGFVGATLVAVTTSLPEISTTAASVRLGAYTMAMANILGTNALEVALLLPADLAYASGPVVNAVDRSALLTASLSVVMTAIYLWGLLERRDRSYFRMGVDSWLVTAAYAGGLLVLYQMAPGGN